jgi:2'-5' RNA ligase
VSDERARLFVALEVPREVREALVGWRTGALDGAEGVRPVAREDLHVTLCFLGWRGWEDVDAIADVCGVVRGRGAAELCLGEAVALPRRRPRVLAVSLEDAEGALGAAQAALSAALQAGGYYEPEQRPFYGHVTVARAGRGARIPRNALLAPPPPLRFHASHIVLYCSHLRRGGASYEALARIALGSA